MRIQFSAARNALRFQLGSGPACMAARRIAAPALLDIGTQGRLLGLEITLPGGDAPYLTIDERDDPLARSADVVVEAAIGDDGALCEVVLPRRGTGYEITYPSGNQ